MELYLIVSLAALVSLLSFLLIRLCWGKQEKLPEISEGAAAEKPSKQDENPSLLFYLVMFIGNVAASGFMKLYYRESWMEISQVLLVLAILWACAWTDYKAYLIPNSFLLIGSGIRLAQILLDCISRPELASFTVISSIVPAIALMIVALLTRLVSKNAIGFGDIKLLMFMGFCLQNDRVWPAVIMSMAVAFFNSLYLVIFKKAGRMTEIPFAPILLIGTVAASIITTV